MPKLDDRIGEWIGALVFGIIAVAIWGELALSAILGNPELSARALFAALACTMSGLALAITLGAVVGLRRVDRPRRPDDVGAAEHRWSLLPLGIVVTGISAGPILNAPTGTWDWAQLAAGFLVGGFILGMATVSGAVGPLRTRKSTSLSGR